MTHAALCPEDVDGSEQSFEPRGSPAGLSTDDETFSQLVLDNSRIKQSERDLIIESDLQNSFEHQEAASRGNRKNR